MKIAAFISNLDINPKSVYFLLEEPTNSFEKSSMLTKGRLLYGFFKQQAKTSCFKDSIEKPQVFIKESAGYQGDLNWEIRRIAETTLKNYEETRRKHILEYVEPLIYEIERGNCPSIVVKMM